VGGFARGNVVNGWASWEGDLPFKRVSFQLGDSIKAGQIKDTKKKKTVQYRPGPTAGVWGGESIK